MLYNDRNLFLFDIDGTLTESRKAMSQDMQDAFLKFVIRTFKPPAGQCYTYLVTGSDYAKVEQQVPQQVISYINGVFACAGNEFYVDSVRIYTNTYDILTAQVSNWLNSELAKSRWLLRTGNHIEKRPGSLNFSIVGRNANPEERASYKAYDYGTSERQFIAERFNKKFPNLIARVGGETGIDIAQKGNDKSQVWKALAPLICVEYKKPTIWFFGDKMSNNGNDAPLAEMLKACYSDTQVIEVSGPSITLDYLGKLKWV
jgi:phosphomannomutase